jgi:PAS domain-containing protein
MSQTSDVLIVGPPLSKQLDFGADTVKNFKEAKLYLEKRKPAVAVFGNPRGGGFEEFCEHAIRHSPETLWILASDGIQPSRLAHWNNHGRLFDIIDGFDDPELETKLKGALEAAGESAQRRQLVELFEGQSQQLKRLTNELEARVDRRHKTLRKSLKTLDETKGRLEAFHKALLGIHRAGSILQMEQTLNEILGATFNLQWIRVRYASQSTLAQHKVPNVLSIDIPFGSDGMKGQVLYAKPEGKRFNPGEVDFFHELTDALALALSRLNALEQAETLKGQWQATFDSIPHPLCLTANDFEILKLNRAFQQACAQHSFRSLIGKNCFQVFFGSEYQPPSTMESPFTFRNSRTGVQETEHFEVIGV